MEVPTTSNIDLLTEFQKVFNTHIRPVAESELEGMSSENALEYDRLRDKLIPASIIIDTFLYLSVHLSEMAADQIIEAQADLVFSVDRCLADHTRASRSASTSRGAQLATAAGQCL